MLILSRKLNERIMIGDDLIITVIGIHHSQVILGIKAPKDIPVHREEIYEKIQQQKMNNS